MNDLDINIASKINILQELKDLIPALTAEEYGILENSIKTDGCRDALLLWGEILVDGHNRYEICRMYGIAFKTAQKCFKNVQEAKEWIIFNQFGRRNLNNYQRAELALKLEDIYSQQARERMLAGNPVLKSEQGRTIEKLAEIARVGKDTIAKVKKIQTEADDEVKKGLQEGDISINQAFQKICGKMNLGQLFTGNNEWYTPAEYIEMARQSMGGIDFDPASCDEAQKIVKAKIYYTAETNGLDKDWTGNVWMNPPYAQPLMNEFTNKLINEYNAGHIKQAIVLTNNGTDTTWFHKLMLVSKVVCFTRGRIHFYNGDTTSSSPLYGQIFYYLGDDPAKFKQYFSEVGLIMHKGIDDIGVKAGTPERVPIDSGE